MTIEQFKAPASGRIISLNVSSFEYALLEEVSIQEMHDLISEYERSRIEEYWDSSLLKIDESGKFISAFQERFEHEGSRFAYIKSSVIQEFFSTDARGKELTNLVRSLSLQDQINIIKSRMPSTRDGLFDILFISRQKDSLDKDFHLMLDKSGSVDVFVENLVAQIKNKEITYFPRNFELLTMMWEKNWFLFPHLFCDWPGKSKFSTLINPIYGKSKSDLILSTYSSNTNKGYDKGFMHVCSFFATSDITTHQDFSEEIIRKFEEKCLEQVEVQYPPKTRKKYYIRYRGKARSIALWLLQTLNNMNPEHRVVLKRAKRDDVADEERRVDGRFRWLKTIRPDLESWANLFALFIQSRETARVQAPIDRLNTFGDFLCTLESPPLKPWLIDRKTHINDVTLKNKNTYREFLIKKSTSKKRRNDDFSTIRSFFDWLRDYLISSEMVAESKFQNPISESDKFGMETTNSKTFRDSLPPYIMNEIKQVLTEDDFAFAKTYPRSVIQVRDQETGIGVKVFDPGVAICLYTLVDTPLRSHQARWLDSGELDEFVFNGVNYEPNPSQFALPARREGAIRLVSDGLRSETWLALWVNTNKTASYDSKIVGYAIPYVSETLAGLLQHQYSWQKKYLPPLREPLSYFRYQEDTRERARPIGIHSPEICPLFRDPNSADLNTPIAYYRLSRFYTAVLEQTQKNIKRKYGQTLKLVTYTSKNNPKWAVDLHSLRVSGITNLIEAGVPLEVVQQFVSGHHTLVMLLHYLKYSPAKLRKFLDNAHERMKNDLDFIGSDMFLESLDEFAPFLLGQDGAGENAGIQALRERDGIMTINPDGICPGTSCSTGGALETNVGDKHGPVLGGQRCGLCRYWLTGPAHLLGQVAAVNNLAFSIRKKGLEIARLNNECLDAEDENDTRKARKIRDRIDLLNRELDVDVNEWAARYRYAETSIALMDDYLAAKKRIIATDASLPVPILTSSPALELKLTLEQAHEFALLDQITQMSTFTTGFTNREAELEKIQFYQRL